MQVDASSCQNLNLAPNTPNIGTGNFPVLPGTEDLNCLFEGNVGAHGITNRHNSSTMSRTGDFVSAIQRLALQDAGHMKFKNESPKYANGLLSIVARKQYGCDTRSSLGNKFLKANSNVHSAPVSLKTGDAMGNILIQTFWFPTMLQLWIDSLHLCYCPASMCSESRGEAGDFARIRNTCFEQVSTLKLHVHLAQCIHGIILFTCFEFSCVDYLHLLITVLWSSGMFILDDWNIFWQATQAYMMGNKALAKELSMKGQLYNLQMKAAHETAREAIYQQRWINSLITNWHDLNLS